MRAAAARAEVVDQLVEVGRLAVERGLVLASGGNLSARLPGGTEFVVTAAGTWLDRLTPADFSVVTLDGEVTAGAERPSSEWKLHQRTYRARPDVNAVVHLHPQHAVLVDALGHRIRLITLDHAVYVRSVGTVPYHPNGSDELADGAAEQARQHDCIVLSHHGCSALGPDVGMAFRRALNLEEAATATYRALLLGDTSCTFPPEALGGLRHDPPQPGNRPRGAPVDWKLEVVVVPVTDVDRAKAFYADRLGFPVDTDHRAGDSFRVVQVTPPGSACSIVFGQGLPQGAPGSMKGTQFVVADIRAAAEQLERAGVDSSGVVHFEDGRMAPGPDPQDADFASFVFFDDPDGNTWSVQQGRRATG